MLLWFTNCITNAVWTQTIRLYLDTVASVEHTWFTSENTAAALMSAHCLERSIFDSLAWGREAQALVYNTPEQPLLFGSLLSIPSQLLWMGIIPTQTHGSDPTALNVSCTTWGSGRGFLLTLAVQANLTVLLEEMVFNNNKSWVEYSLQASSSFTQTFDLWRHKS